MLERSSVEDVEDGALHVEHGSSHLGISLVDAVAAGRVVPLGYAWNGGQPAFEDADESSPLLLSNAILVKLTSPGPILYGQRRIGRNGEPFTIWKYRTMVHDADTILTTYLTEHPELQAEWEADHKLRHDPRITPIGRRLRSTSLDELPQLWNVLNGTMSLVGPRPIVQDETHKYGHVFELYTRVPPGITGLWQISGRNDTGYDERVTLDATYIRNWSPWVDLTTLWKTVAVVLGKRGAY